MNPDSEAESEAVADFYDRTFSHGWHLVLYDVMVYSSPATRESAS